MSLSARTVTLIAVLSLPGLAGQFSLPCGTPPPPLRSILKAIEQHDPTPIDAVCPADGESTQTAKQLESTAKSPSRNNVNKRVLADIV